MLVRKRLAGDIVLQFESQNDDTFFIKFRDIQRIEKDPKSENGIKITMNKYLDSEFVVKCADRRRLLDEIKKYWKIFLDEQKEKLMNSKSAQGSQVGEEGGYLDSIKKIIFRT